MPTTSDATAGGLLLCRAVPAAVGPAAPLLRERLLLAPAGADWSVLVPEGRPWLAGDEPVDRVLSGWATALAVGAPWPVLALWWDSDRCGYTLASGFRRSVGYVWLADGTPVGEDEAMATFASRLRLDPVLDMQSLDELTRPDTTSDARARLRGLLAVVSRTGLSLPPGLAVGEPAERLGAAIRGRPGVEVIEWLGWRKTVRAEPGVAGVVGVVENGPLGPWLRGPRARALALAELVAGVPVLAFGARRRSAGWVVAGVLLLGHGALGLSYDVVRARD